jgi:hypothetical protein
VRPSPNLDRQLLLCFFPRLGVRISVLSIAAVGQGLPMYGRGEACKRQFAKATGRVFSRRFLHGAGTS